MSKQSTLKASLIPDGSPVAVSSNIELGTLDLGKTSGAFAIQVLTTDGSGPVDIDIVLDFSLDGVNYTEVSREKVTNTTNVAIFDFPNGTGVDFAKIRAEVVTGTLNVASILFSGKALR